MSAASNPPQLQLSLGHQTFKRSFTQFGLDVDDGEDSRSDSGSASAGSSSFSGSSSSGRVVASGSASGSTGTRSVSSGSSNSSPGSVDLFGYNDGERSDRNKRARSEGPEHEDISVSVSSAGNSSAESLDAASVLSVSSSDASLLGFGLSSNPSPGEQGSPQQTNASISSFNTTSGFTLPALDFGPSTPSVAEFVALRSGSSNTRTADNPPGFANMLSPRSSSPAPPPAVEIDVAMHDDDSDEDPFPSLRLQHSARQNLGANTSMNGGFLDTARSDALLNSATDRLRSVMDRARTFDRTLAPLRSNTADSSAGGSSHQRSYTRPRLPPFDFESRRRASPYRAPESANSAAGLTNTFDRLAQPSSNTGSVNSLGGSTFGEGRNLSIAGRMPTGIRHSLTPVSDTSQLDVGSDEDTEIEEEEDSIIVDRELTVEPELPDAGHSSEISSASSSLEVAPPSPGRRANANGVNNGSEDSASGLLHRIIGGLTSPASSSEAEDSTRSSSSFDSSQLDPRLFGGEATGNRTNRPPRLQLGLTSPRLTFEMTRRTDDLLSGLYGPDSPHSAPRRSPAWSAGRERVQEEARSEANIDRFRGWPWSDLLSPPATDSMISGLGPRSNPEAQTRSTTTGQSPRLELRPHSPFFHLPEVSSPGASEALRAAQEEVRRIERLVEMDMETNSQTTFGSPFRRPPARSSREGSSTPSRTSAFRSPQNQYQAGALSPTRRPNLPTLRSAIFGPLRNNDEEDAPRPATTSLRTEDWEQIDMGIPQANASGVTTSMTEASLRSRGMFLFSPAIAIVLTFSFISFATARRDDQPTRRLSMFNAEGQPQSRFIGGQRNLPVSLPGRRSDEEHASSPFGMRIPIDTSRSPLSSAASQTSSVFDPVRTLRERDREIAREASERNRQLLQNWFPPIYEEERIQESERRTRLREMRDQHRLSISSRPLLANRQERPIQPQAQTDSLDVLRWAHSWDEVLRSAGRPTPSHEEEDVFRPVHPSSGYWTRPSSSNAFGNAQSQSSSSEAAAYFAAGPSFSPSRQAPGRLSPSILRRRSRLLSDSGEERTTEMSDSDLLREPWNDFEMNMDPSDTSVFGREQRHSAQSLRNFAIPTPSDELLQLLYAGPLEDAGSSQRQANTGTNDLTSGIRPSGYPNIGDLPPLEGSQLRAWTSINIQHRVPTTNASELPSRASTLRNASQPPSLPPLQFDRLSSPPDGARDDTDGRIFGNQEPSMQRNAPWRRQQTERQTDSSDSNLVRNWSNGDFAVHRAMMLRSVQARQPTRDTVTSYDIPGVVSRAQGRSDSSQQSSGVLGTGSLPRTPRNPSLYREPNQGRSVPSRNDSQAHVRWGELRDDASESRPSVHPAARPWAETSFRTRRRSLSSLFAPPPDSADALPPNRTRGAGPAGGDPHAPAAPDWLEAISATRARSRHRARLARFENEPQRPFFRFSRNRPSLRAFGDFMVRSWSLCMSWLSD